MAEKIPSKVTREFGRRLRACRLAAGYVDAADFANHLAIDRNRYRSYERGEREPPFELLVRLAKELGKSLDFLLDR